MTHALSILTVIFLALNANAAGVILIGDDLAIEQASKEVVRNGGHVKRKLELMSGAVAEIPASAMNGLKRKFHDVSFIPDVEVQLVKPISNAKGGKPSVSQPAQVVPWGIDSVRARETHSFIKGAGVKVCIVDTGIEKSHPDLAANIIGGRNFIVQKGALNSSRWDDDNGHGTHVAGTIAALDNSIGVVGVAPEAKIYAVKVLDARGSGTLSGVIDGINACISAGTHVINMSLGAGALPSSDVGVLMQTAVNAARSAGIEVVVSAGNEGQNISNSIPAGLANLIAVSAMDSSYGFPSWSNYGLSAGDFAAPGVAVRSTYKGGTYAELSGTSMASPHVAGVAALKKAAQSAAYASIDLYVSTALQGSGLIDALRTVAPTTE